MVANRGLGCFQSHHILGKGTPTDHDTYRFEFWVFGIGIPAIIKIHNPNPSEYPNIPANVIR